MQCNKIVQLIKSNNKLQLFTTHIYDSTCRKSVDLKKMMKMTHDKYKEHGVLSAALKCTNSATCADRLTENMIFNENSKI